MSNPSLIKFFKVLSRQDYLARTGNFVATTVNFGSLVEANVPI